MRGRQFDAQINLVINPGLVSEHDEKMPNYVGLKVMVRW
jgi:hypothetical protein